MTYPDTPHDMDCKRLFPGKKKRQSSLEIAAHVRILHLELPKVETEYAFHPTRRWRFDFAWPEYKLAIELEGAIWMQGRHSRGAGFNKDCEKYNAATLMGWRILRYNTSNINDMIKDLKQFFSGYFRKGDSS